MSFVSPNMGLTVFNLVTDVYDHNAVANNMSAIDIHDHSSGKGVQVNTGGLANGAVTTSKLGFTTSVITSGLVSARPAPSTLGHIYYATDLQHIYFDSGSAWDPLIFKGDGNSPLLSVTVSSNTTLSPGNCYFATAGNINLTLPFPFSGNLIAVVATSGMTGNAPVDVTASSGGILGPGANLSSVVVLGIPGASMLLQGNGSYWAVIGGQPDSGWISMTSFLAPNITNPAASSLSNPYARMIGDQVFMKGAMQNNTGGVMINGAQWATIPPFLQPPVDKILNAQYGSIPSSANNVFAYINSANGHLQIGAAPQPSIPNTNYVFLDNITYSFT